MFLSTKRWQHFTAMVLIGDGVMALLHPQKDALAWKRGPEPWKKLMHELHQRPRPDARHRGRSDRRCCLVGDSAGRSKLGIDQEFRARSMARTTARALFPHSTNSLSGTESATMPAPA